MKEVTFRNYTIRAEEKDGAYHFHVDYKGRDIEYVSSDKTLFDDIDDNRRRARAARSFVYEKAKKIYYCGNE